MANSRGIESRRRRAKIIVACAVGPIVAALSPRVIAGVQLTNVAAGTAAVSQQGSITTIRTGTNNTILYFSKFDIAGGSTVNFMQPSAAGRVLDHVTSATPSLINGTIQSNGSVYLINPAGVIFGAGAVVDVNRFYAAAASFSDQDFLRGVDHFTGVSGMVSNSGQIRANQVSLIGSQVMNAGNIIAPNGYVAMLAGSDVLVSEEGSHITAKVVAAVPVAASGMAGGAAAGGSSGTAGSFDLRKSAMAAGDVYSLAIRHTGSIQASNVLIDGGQGKVQISGTIDAASHTAGAVGGTVAITGGEVDLVSANINASGPGGGGTIEIGGGVHGGGDLAHAQIVSVDSSSIIDADALSNGTGGTIAIWSDGTTSEAGMLTARGGALGGNGGYIETSGDFLQVSGAPNASAPHGNAGTWVMDPINIDIQNGTGTGTFTGPTVFNADIVAALNGGTNVVVDTSNQDNPPDTGMLTQDADAIIAVTPTTNVTLTLRSNDTMLLQGGITSSGAGTLSVELDQLGSGGAVTINTNAININGSFKVVGGNFSLASGISLSASGVTMGSGTVTADSGSVVVAMGSVSLASPVSTGAGVVSVSSATSITTSGTGSIGTTDGNVTLSSLGAVTIGAAVNTGGGTFAPTGTSFTSNLGGTISTAGGNATIVSTGAVIIGDTVTTGGGNFTSGGTSFTTNTGATIGTAGGNLSITATGPDQIGAAVTTGAGTFSVSGASSFANTATGTITTVNGLVSIGSTGAVTIGGVVGTGGGNFISGGTSFTTTTGATIGTAGGNLSITAIGADQLGAAVTTGAGTFSATGGTTFTTVTGGTIGTTDGEVDITGSGAISIGDAISTGGGGIFIDFGHSGAAAATHGGGVSIGAAITTGGGVLSVGGTTFASTTTGTVGPNGTLSTAGGDLTISPTSTVMIGASVSTGAGSFTESGGTQFSSTAAGTITATGVSITTSIGTTIGGAVNTDGGAFTVVAGLDFENDAPITVGTGTTSNTPFSVSEAGTGSININGAITWTGSGGVTISGGPSQVTTTSLGTITATGTTAMPVSLFTTIVDNPTLGLTGVTIGAAVVTTGAFTASGGNFILSANVPLTAGSVSLNLPSTTPATTPNTVTIGGPIVATLSGAGGGFIDIGGAISTTDNTTGTLTTSNAPITITNNGVASQGNAVTTGGGDFTVNGSSLFTASSAPITTSGGNISITTTTSDGVDIATDSPVNTGGGSFTVTAQSFESDSTISDGGVASAGGKLQILTTGGTGVTTVNGTIAWSGGTGRLVDIGGGGTVSVTSILSSGATPLPVTIYTTATGSGVTIVGAINTSGTFASSGNSVNISSTGSIDAQTVSLNIITGFDSSTVIPGDVSVAGPITTNGGVFAAGGTSFTSSGAGSITTNSGDVNLLTPGGINLGGAIITGGGAFNATNDNAFTSTVGGTITTLGGAVTINSIGTVANATGEIVIGDEINTGGGAFSSNGSTFTSSGEITDGGINDGQSVTITTTGGDITLNTGGDINWAASLGSITFVVPSGSVLGLGAVITGNVAEPIDFTGVTLSLVGQASTITGGNISFGAIVNPDATVSPALAVQSAGTVTFGGAIGTPANPIGSLTVEANGSSAQPVTTLNGDVNSYGTVDFGGSVILAADVAVTASDLSTAPVDHLIEFDGTIEGPHGLTVTIPLPPNIANGPGVEEVRFNSNIGDVTPLAFLNVNSNGDGIVFFRAGPPGSTATSEFGNLPGVTDPQPLTVVDIASGGSFKINDGPPPSPKQTAIVISSIDSYGPLTVNIGSPGTPNAANLFAVGQYEKLTSFGALNINTNGGTAQVGDLSTFGNMTISAANVIFLLRQPTLENNVELDKGVDLIASGEMTLPANATYTAVTPAGTGAFGVPGFIAGSFNPSSNISGIAASLKTAISIAPSIPASAFFFPGFNLLLDLTPSTLSSKLPTFVAPIPFVFDLPVGGAVPRQELVAGTVTPDFKNAMMPSYPGPIVQQDLKDNGVFTREASLEEILEGTDSIVVYNDTPRKRRPRADDYSVAAPRLNSSRVQKFLDDYHEMFAGTPGNSADMPSRRAQIASDLQTAWDAYVGQNGYKQATGVGFQHYVATTPSGSKAANELIQLNALLQQLNTLGLSHKEAQMAFQHNILAGLPANGMQDGDLMAAVEKAGNE